MLKTTNKGFTLIELVLMIAVIGILVVTVLPQFVNIGDKAETTAAEDLLGTVNDGISLFRANSAVQAQGNGYYPPVLDTLPVGTTCSPANRCFTNVLMNGYADTRWSKTGDTQYTFTTKTVSAVYSYDSASGKFSKVE